MFSPPIWMKRSLTYNQVEVDMNNDRVISTLPLATYRSSSSCVVWKFGTLREPGKSVRMHDVLAVIEIACVKCNFNCTSSTFMEISCCTFISF
jgi:hypothetical protein